MRMVPVRVAQMMLHVADDGILPVAKINCAVGPDVDRHWAKIRVTGANQVLLPLAFETRAVLAHLHAINPLKPNHIAVEKIPLELRRKVPAAKQGRTGAR